MAHVRKRAQLGIDPGTAAHQLRKKILFSLVQEVGRDKCWHCGQKIQNASDLSIEHKQPWLDVDPDLFWDLENIAFSHRVCNRPNRPWYPPRAGHGRPKCYQRGCRCEKCRAWKAMDNKKYRRAA